MILIFHSFIGSLARTNAYYGRGTGLIMISYVGCTGEEPNLLNCTHSGYGRTYCGHSEDAGVRCPGRQLVLLLLKLALKFIPLNSFQILSCSFRVFSPKLKDKIADIIYKLLPYKLVLCAYYCYYVID